MFSGLETSASVSPALGILLMVRKVRKVRRIDGERYALAKRCKVGFESGFAFPADLLEKHVLRSRRELCVVRQQLLKDRAFRGALPILRSSIIDVRQRGVRPDFAAQRRTTVDFGPQLQEKLCTRASVRTRKG